MNTSKNHILRNLGITAVSLAAIMFGCVKDDVESQAVTCSGAPSVVNVVTPTNRELDIKGAKLDEWVIVKGSNLCDINSININNIAVDIKQAYITANEITFKIPKEVPKTITDKITMSGSSGSIDVGFKVYLAPLIAYGFGGATEAFTPIGQNMIIKCKNLDLYSFTLANTKVMFGKIEAKATKVTAEEINVTVPAGALDRSIVTISNGSSTKEVAEKYKDKSIVIYDNDDPNKNGWTGVKSSEGPEPSPIDGKYRVCVGKLKAWDWNENFHIAGNQPLANYGVKAGKADQYVVKFEVNVPKNWTSNPLRIWYRPSSGTMNYNFPWGGNNFSGNAFKTSGWQTVTIPLSDFMYSEDDAGVNKGKNITTLLDADLKDYKEIRIYMFGGDEKDMELYWDNFRIIPAPVFD